MAGRAHPPAGRAGCSPAGGASWGGGDLFDALDGAPPRIRRWLVLAGWAGLRAVEIALLRRECVLDAAVQPVLLIAADATKGPNERLVPMSAFVLGELCDYGLPAS